MEQLHRDAHDDELNKPMLWLAGFCVLMFAIAFVFAIISKNPQVAVNDTSTIPGDVLTPPITQPATPEPSTTGQGQSR
jgi:hypothetical protein